MPVRLRCKGCKTTLNVPDQFAGKKVKCPKCTTVLVVPAREEEEFVAVEAVPEESITDKPAKNSSPARARRDEDEEPREAHRGRIKADPERDRKRARDDEDRRSRVREEDEEDRKRKKKRPRDEEDEEDDRDRKSGKKGDFKPCPKCSARGAKRVLWTAWGSFYGPAMFSHVRCPECAYCYNGRTGRSNLLAAIIFTCVPLIGIGAIIGGIVYMLMIRGHL